MTPGSPYYSCYSTRRSTYSILLSICAHAHMRRNKRGLYILLAAIGAPCYIEGSTARVRSVLADRETGAEMEPEPVGGAPAAVRVCGQGGRGHRG